MEVSARNNNIELLRIVTIITIILYHVVDKGIADPDSVNNMALGLRKVILQFIDTWGGVGNNIFFIITAYYSSGIYSLYDKTPIFEKQKKKIVMIELQMLFYSISLTMIGFFILGVRPSEEILVKTVFPFITGMWWYPTAYIIFLLLQPFIDTLLDVLKRELHLKLCWILIIMWSVMAMMPGASLYNNELTTFIEIYILISYIKKYASSNIFENNSLKIFGGLTVINILGILVMDYLWGKTGLVLFANYCKILSIGNNKLLTLLLAYSCFCIFNKKVSIKNTVVNNVISVIAPTTMGIYLFHMHPILEDYIFKGLFPNLMTVEPGKFIFVIVLGTLVIFTTAVVFEKIRHALFKEIGRIIK